MSEEPYQELSRRAKSFLGIRYIGFADPVSIFRHSLGLEIFITTPDGEKLAYKEGLSSRAHYSHAIWMDQALFVLRQLQVLDDLANV